MGRFRCFSTSIGCIRRAQRLHFKNRNLIEDDRKTVGYHRASRNLGPHCSRRVAGSPCRPSQQWVIVFQNHATYTTLCRLRLSRFKLTSQHMDQPSRHFLLQHHIIALGQHMQRKKTILSSRSLDRLVPCVQVTGRGVKHNASEIQIFSPIRGIHFTTVKPHDRDTSRTPGWSRLVSCTSYYPSLVPAVG